MRGSIQRRGRNSWRLKFDVATDGGARKTQYVTIKGSRRDAQGKLAELVAAVTGDRYIAPDKIAVGTWTAGRIDAWEAAGTISARTAQRYRQILRWQIRPHIGDKLVQQVRPLNVEGWHTALRAAGKVGGKPLSALTIRHCHAVLHKALADAVRGELVARNVAALVSPPKIDDSEIVIVRDLPDFLAKLKGSQLETVAVVALFAGLRLGEILALKWSRVDLDRKVLLVREALEITKAHGLRFKLPKSKAGTRDITLPDILVTTLREHRKAQLELRLKLGAGRLPDDALLFGDLEGDPQSPNRISEQWGNFATSINMPDIRFHSLRHTHASQLIDAGVDIVTIAKRLGHAKPDITLRTYAHLFRNDDSRAAAAINAALGKS